MSGEILQEIAAVAQREKAERASRRFLASLRDTVDLKPPEAFHADPRYGGDLHRADLAWRFTPPAADSQRQRSGKRFSMPVTFQRKAAGPANSIMQSVRRPRR